MVMDPERIESVKAGTVAAIIGTAISFVFVVFDTWLMGQGFTQAWLLHAIQRLAVAVVCCFLFGVTYRYIVRQDPNPHLKSGAVGAFALTRSLGQLETLELSALSMDQALPIALPIAESFGLFLTVRLVLDWGLKQQWFQPFASNPKST
ncbi:MAG: hypothetical protein AAFU84_11510 [Cyanobacteria bacterium J06633_23]